MRRGTTYLAAVFAVILLLSSGSVQAALIVDFDAPSTPYTIIQHGSAPGPAPTAGGPTGTYLRLTNDVHSQTNTLAFDEVPAFTGPQPGGIEMQFDYRMSEEATHTGCCGQRADGFGVALMATALYGTSGPGPGTLPWERPAYPAAFGVGFDIFESPDFDSDVVTLNWGGVQIAQFATTGMHLNTGAFNQVNITVIPDGTNAKVSMTITEDIHGSPGAPLTMFTDVVIPGMDMYNLSSFRAVFGGRTGGAFVAADIDNINFQSIPEPMTIALFGFGGLALLRRRRQA